MNNKIIEKKILKRNYKIQRIDGLPKKHVTPPPEVYERIKNENRRENLYLNMLIIASL